MERDMLATVRGLLAKAEDAGVTDEERDALTGKAAALMAKYGIDKALAYAREPGQDELIDKRIVVDPPFAEAKSRLFWAVASPLRTKAIRIETRLSDGKNRYRYTMHLFGFRSDVERVELLWTSLLLQSANGLKNVQVPPGRDPGAYRDSWLSGFSTAVYWRLLEAEKTAADEAQSASGDGTSVALVLADRGTLVDQRAGAAHPNSRQSGERKLSGGGTAAGYQAGQRADLGTGRKVGTGAGSIRS